MNGGLFQSPAMPMPFPLFGNDTVRRAQRRTVMGVQGVFPLAHVGNYNVTARSESVQNHVLNKSPLAGKKGGGQ